MENFSNSVAVSVHFYSCALSNEYFSHIILYTPIYNSLLKAKNDSDLLKLFVVIND